MHLRPSGGFCAANCSLHTLTPAPFTNFWLRHYSCPPSPKERSSPLRHRPEPPLRGGRPSPKNSPLPTALRVFGRPAAAARPIVRTLTAANFTPFWLCHYRWVPPTPKARSCPLRYRPEPPLRGGAAPTRTDPPPPETYGALSLLQSGCCCAADCSHPNSCQLCKFLVTPL